MSLDVGWRLAKRTGPATELELDAWVHRRWFVIRGGGALRIGAGNLRLPGGRRFRRLLGQGKGVWLVQNKVGSWAILDTLKSGLNEDGPKTEGGVLEP